MTDAGFVAADGEHRAIVPCTPGKASLECYLKQAFVAIKAWYNVLPARNGAFATFVCMWMDDLPAAALCMSVRFVPDRTQLRVACARKPECGGDRRVFAVFVRLLSMFATQKRPEVLQTAWCDMWTGQVHAAPQVDRVLLGTTSWLASVLAAPGNWHSKAQAMHLLFHPANATKAASQIGVPALLLRLPQPWPSWFTLQAAVGLMMGRKRATPAAAAAWQLAMSTIVTSGDVPPTDSVCETSERTLARFMLANFGDTVA